MRRAAGRDLRFRAEPASPRIALHLGPDKYILNRIEAYRLANELVDAAEQLTQRPHTTAEETAR